MLVNNKLDLHKTLLPPESSSSNSEAVLYDVGAALAAPRAEKQLKDADGGCGGAGILRKSSNGERSDRSEGRMGRCKL